MTSMNWPWSGQPVSAGIKNQVAGGRDRQKLGDGLHERKHDDLLYGH